LQLINPSTSPNELTTTLMPHSIIHGHACFAYFNKIWGIPLEFCYLPFVRLADGGSFIGNENDRTRVRLSPISMESRGRQFLAASLRSVGEEFRWVTLVISRPKTTASLSSSPAMIYRPGPQVTLAPVSP
jgi:hypothetical protein